MPHSSKRFCSQLVLSSNSNNGNSLDWKKHYHPATFCSFADIIKGEKFNVYNNFNQKSYANIDQVDQYGSEVFANHKNTNQSPINAHVELVNTDHMCSKHVYETHVVNNGFKKSADRGYFSPLKNNNVYYQKTDLKTAAQRSDVNNGFKNTAHRGCFSPVENNNNYYLFFIYLIMFTIRKLTRKYLYNVLMSMLVLQGIHLKVIIVFGL